MPTPMAAMPTPMPEIPAVAWPVEDRRDPDAGGRDPESEQDAGVAVAAGGSERDGGEQRGAGGSLASLVVTGRRG